MEKNPSSFTILIADDDDEDCVMIKEAFEEAQLDYTLHFVKDGEELFDYLYHRDKYSEQTKRSSPDLLLLDLNMPRKSGIEALREIKADPDLRRLPIVVFTTSHAEEDIGKTYDLGVNSFITKPASFERLVDIMQVLTKYWFEIARIPRQRVSA